MKKKLVFISGTRADYGKLKPLMQAIEKSEDYELYIFISGMHLLERYGSTYREIQKDAYKNIHIAYGLSYSDNMCVNLGNTILHFSGYINNIKPDMIIVHGDRIDALAGATVGALNNIIVAHIEGGEISGTIDESIRHAVSKFAHLHFVSNEDARKRLMQLGEKSENIFIIGSPDIDIMITDKLPTFNQAKERYNLNFDEYGILLYHPVTTEVAKTGKHAKELVDAIIESGKNYVVIYPNSDLGSVVIINEYLRFEGIDRIKVFPSLRFEYFLTLLKNTSFIIGNSSAGIREAEIYSIPAIDIGSRQQGRYLTEKLNNIIHIDCVKDEILKAIEQTYELKESLADNKKVFGKGDSTKKFMEIIAKDDVWERDLQKSFIDREY